MTPEEFIEKWNVAYEDREQKIEFAHEMRNDLLSLINKDQEMAEPIEINIKEAVVKIINGIDFIFVTDQRLLDFYKGIKEHIKFMPDHKFIVKLNK